MIYSGDVMIDDETSGDARSGRHVSTSRIRGTGDRRSTGVVTDVTVQVPVPMYVPSPDHRTSRIDAHARAELLSDVRTQAMAHTPAAIQYLAGIVALARDRVSDRSWRLCGIRAAEVLVRAASAPAESDPSAAAQGLIDSLAAAALEARELLALRLGMTVSSSDEGVATAAVSPSPRKRLSLREARGLLRQQEAAAVTVASPMRRKPGDPVR